MIHVRAKNTTVFIRVTFTLHVLDPCAPHRTSKGHSHRPARARQPKLTEPSRVRGEGGQRSFGSRGQCAHLSWHWLSAPRARRRALEGEHVQELARRADRMGNARPVMADAKHGWGDVSARHRAARFPRGGQADKAPAPETSLQRSSGGRLDELQVS